VKIDIPLYAYEPSRGELGGIRKPIELAKGLQAIGHQATVYLPSFLHVDNGNVELVQYPALRARILRPISAYLSMNWKLWRRSRAARPDLVYSRTSRNILTGLVARGIGARFIFEVNGDAFGEQGWSQGVMRALSILLADWINCRLAHRIIAVTSGLAEMVQRRYGVPAAKIRVVGSGSDLDEIRPLDPRASRESLAIDPESPTIVFLGVLYEHQGVQVLLDSMPRVRSEVPQVRLLIVGDGPMMGRLRAHAETLDLGESVVFAGSVPYGRVKHYLGAATCCVAPFLTGRGETSPLKLFDYMAAGRPVVASEIPSIRNILEASEAVIAVPPENPSRLAVEILRLLRDPALCESLGEAGRAYVEQHDGWPKIAERVISACPGTGESERSASS
jgi:glycosyltransferase involved in cell wall biosynthesis